MNGCTEPPTQRTSTEDVRSRDVTPTIKARDDVDSCGCLDCRNVEPTAIRRTVLDALVWSVHLFRSYPSIVAFTGVIIFANRLVETDSTGILSLPVIGVFETLTAVAFIFLIRAYVGTIVAGELTGDPVTIREGLYRSITRMPAVVGLIFLIVFSVMTIPFLVVFPVFILAGVIPGNPVELIGFPVAATASGIVFVVPALFLLFKFWFAPEACVIGQYGPIESLRVSWQLTANYRRRFVLVAVIAIGSALSFHLPTSLPGMGMDLVSLHPVVRVLAASVGELLSVVWASAYAHIYIQGIVS